MNGLRIGVAAAALLGAAGCGSGSSAGDKPAATFDAAGTVTLHDAAGLDQKGGICVPDGGYSDLQNGAAVAIYDPRGKAVGLGHLALGHSGSDPNTDCVMEFTVTDIPNGTGIYSVEVTHRGKVPFKRSDAKHIELTIGD